MIIVAFLAVTCIVYFILYNRFQRENVVSDVKECWEALACLAAVYTILIMTGVALLAISIASKL